MISALVRHRILFGWMLALILLYLARPQGLSLAAGLPVALGGLAFRAAAAGVIHKGTRLARRGPYRFTRNPLYFGSVLLALGFGIMSGRLLAPAALMLAAAMIFPGLIRREEAELQARFGPEFETFCREVPRFVPRRLGPGIFESFSVEQYRRNREYNALLGFSAAAFVILIKSF